jgi:hypothetical protein
VIRVSERQFGEKYAQVTAAVRELTDNFGLRIIVDGSPKSIPPEILSTLRETVIVVESMSKEEIESIPQFESVVKFLKAHHLDGPVWSVLGGSPAQYVKLKESIQILPDKPDAALKQVKDHLEAVLFKALNNVIRKSNANTKEIIKLFKNEKKVKMSMEEFENLGYALDPLNEVFREVEREDESYVEPASAALSLIISNDIHGREGVRELLNKLFKWAGK